MSFVVIIPARYESSRLPGKPLEMIGDKPMIRHVWERAVASGAARVIIATDDARIAAAVKEFGAEACLTAKDHESGSDRLAEVVDREALDEDTLIVNVQGDEPFIAPENIRQVAGLLADGVADNMATLCTAITDESEIFDANVVKVVFDNQGRALYFSRAPIPWQRGSFEGRSRSGSAGSWFRHIGIYAYRAGFLRHYVNWPAAELERIEALEQLRVLARGHAIGIALAETPPAAGVDTEQDLHRAREHYRDLQKK